ncbi:MAG TPA: hypothetical protein VNH18_14825 [Bryobacteraceae bacterium]|nr:hypothetical protein [Bryobacteraceae bacterium]
MMLARYLIASAIDWIDIRTGLVEDARDPDGVFAAILSGILTVILVATVYAALDIFGGAAD